MNVGLQGRFAPVDEQILGVPGTNFEGGCDSNSGGRPGTCLGFRREKRVGPDSNTHRGDRSHKSDGRKWQDDTHALAGELERLRAAPSRARRVWFCSCRQRVVQRLLTRAQSAAEFPQVAPGQRKMANDPCRWKTSACMANTSASLAEVRDLSRDRAHTRCNIAGFGPSVPPSFLLAFQVARRPGRRGVTGRTLRHLLCNYRKTLRGYIPA